MPVPLLDLRAQHAAIRDEVVSALMGVVDSQLFILGPAVEQLEQQVAELSKTKYAIGCASGTDALLLAMRALDIGRGDEVITTPFTFFATAGTIHNVGATPVFVDIEPQSFNIAPSAVAAAINSKTKAIILNTPSNPSGAVVAPEDLEAIVRLAHKNGIYVLLDECYVYLNFTGEVVSGGSFTDCKEHIVVLGSLSKTYAMTGWRAGFALGPKAVIAAMSKLQSQSTSNTASMVQRASIAALTGSQECVAEFRADYVKLRDQILAGFETIPGLTCTVPQGAFYVYPNVSKFIGKGGIKSASDLAAKLLSEAHVVVVPGEAFGTTEHIRLSYAVSHDVVDEGVKRMREYFATLG